MSTAFGIALFLIGESITLTIESVETYLPNHWQLQEGVIVAVSLPVGAVFDVSVPVPDSHLRDRWAMRGVDLHDECGNILLDELTHWGAYDDDNGWPESYVVEKQWTGPSTLKFYVYRKFTQYGKRDHDPKRAQAYILKHGKNAFTVYYQRMKHAK